MVDQIHLGAAYFKKTATHKRKNINRRGKKCQLSTLTMWLLRSSATERLMYFIISVVKQMQRSVSLGSTSRNFIQQINAIYSWDHVGLRKSLKTCPWQLHRFHSNLLYPHACTHAHTNLHNCAHAWECPNRGWRGRGWVNTQITTGAVQCLWSSACCC